MKKQFVGQDGFRRMESDGKTFILNDLFHYHHMARRAASDYKFNGLTTKIATIGDGQSKGLIGVWLIETETSA